MNIVFDFGAVLFTWRPVEIVMDVFPQRASDVAQGTQLAHAMFGHEDWQNFDRGLLTLNVVAQRTSDRLDLDASTLRDLFQSIPQRLVPMRDSMAVLRKLLDRRTAGNVVRALYFLSNMPEPYARELEQKHAFLSHFDGGIFSADEKCSKPDPRIYQMLQSRYGFDTASTVFIDDMPANVDAARAQGWRAIHFTSAKQLETDLADHCGL